MMLMSSSIFYACKKDTFNEIPPKTTPYTLPSIRNFRPMPVEADNPMTVEGVALGKNYFSILFFQEILLWLAQAVIYKLIVFRIPE